MATIADLLAKTLADAGVERIWGVTGDSLNGLSVACAVLVASFGCTFGMRKRPPLRREQRQL